MKILGWLITVIGAITALVGTTNYAKTSQEVAAWYFYRSELEGFRTAMFIGLAIAFIGIIILLAAYLKKK